MLPYFGDYFRIRYKIKSLSFFNVVEESPLYYWIKNFPNMIRKFFPRKSLQNWPKIVLSFFFCNEWPHFSLWNAKQKKTTSLEALIPVKLFFGWPLYLVYMSISTQSLTKNIGALFIIYWYKLYCTHGRNMISSLNHFRANGICSMRYEHHWHQH